MMKPKDNDLAAATHWEQLCTLGQAQRGCQKFPCFVHAEVPYAGSMQQQEQSATDRTALFRTALTRNFRHRM